MSAGSGTVPGSRTCGKPGSLWAQACGVGLMPALAANTRTAAIRGPPRQHRRSPASPYRIIGIPGIRRIIPGPIIPGPIIRPMRTAIHPRPSSPKDVCVDSR